MLHLYTVSFIDCVRMSPCAFDKGWIYTFIVGISIFYIYLGHQLPGANVFLKLVEIRA